MQISKKILEYESIYNAVESRENISIDPSLLITISHHRDRLIKLIKKGNVMYGINTGFGALRGKNISPEDVYELQENLIVSHAVGVGDPVYPQIVKIMMFLIANYLTKGYSGVRSVLPETLVNMINRDVIPIVPEKGSVGSSGDLAPSSHLVLVMIGKGEAWFRGKPMKGRDAMKLAGIPLITLEAKEGLALINNTAMMTAHAIVALTKSAYLADMADLASALSSEALRATTHAFDKRIHELKPHKGQLLVAKHMRELLENSTMTDMNRIQDQYSIRCIPQVHGAVREAIDYVEGVVNTEINSVTDNPLIFDAGNTIEVISGGNFHGESVGIAMDTLKLAVCEFANISDRRIASLLDPHHNFGLPPFLAKKPGLNSGMMILQYTTAALVSENKILAHPAVVDSIPTSANVEDLVSMGTISARKTVEVLKNITNVLAIELLVACQAIDFRLNEGYKLGRHTGKAYNEIRKIVPFFDKDSEYMSSVSKIVRLIDLRIL